MSRLNRCGFLVIVFGFALVSQAFSQTRDENWSQCTDDDAAVSQKGCSAVLNSGEEGPRGRFAALVNRGIAYRDLGLTAQALADFTQAIALNGADVDVLMERGATYGQDGAFDKAIQDYGQALDLEGDNAPALFARGVFKRLNGDLPGGDADIVAARRLNPDIAAIMADRGITEANLQAPQTSVAPAVIPDTVPTVSSEPPAKTNSGGYPLLLVAAGLVLVLTIFLLLRPSRSSSSQTDSPSPAKRPGAVTALGVIHLIGSAVGLMSIFGFVDYARRSPQLQMPTVMLVAAVLFGMCLLSIACGIGLLRLRPHGRSLQLGFAWVGLLAIPLGTIISILILYYLKKPEIKGLFRPAAPLDESPGQEIPRRSFMSAAPLRTIAIVASIAALFAIGVVVGRQTSASTNELAESQFAFGLLSETGKGIESPYMTERDISGISVTSDQSQFAALSIAFTPEGASKMRTLTSQNIGRSLVFVIDGSPDVAHPATIQSTIAENASLSFVSTSDAHAYVAKLKASRDPNGHYR